MWICYFATPKTVEVLIFLVSQVSLDHLPTATRAKLLIDVAIGSTCSYREEGGEKRPHQSEFLFLRKGHSLFLTLNPAWISSETLLPFQA